MEKELKEHLSQFKSPSTIKQYNIICKKLMKKIPGEANCLKTLYLTDKVMEVLKTDYSEKSLRTHLGYVIGVLKNSKPEDGQDVDHNEALKKYRVALKKTLDK